MKNSPHTPTPWKIFLGIDCQEKDHDFIALQSPWIEYAFSKGHPAHTLAEANAAFIVKALIIYFAVYKRRSMQSPKLRARNNTNTIKREILWLHGSKTKEAISAA